MALWLRLQQMHNIMPWHCDTHKHSVTHAHAQIYCWTPCLKVVWVDIEVQFTLTTISNPPHLSPKITISVPQWLKHTHCGLVLWLIIIQSSLQSTIYFDDHFQICHIWAPKLLSVSHYCGSWSPNQTLISWSLHMYIHKNDCREDLLLLFSACRFDQRAYSIMFTAQ